MAESAVPRDEHRAASLKENAARIASAMQFFRGLCDHASLIARASQLVVAWLAVFLAPGDRGRALGGAAGDPVELPLAGKAVIQPVDGQTGMQGGGEERGKRGRLAAVLGPGRA